jgi:hypothetical protein
MNPSPWTKVRINELKHLISLLDEVKSIDRGSGVIKRLQKCERLAEVLTKTDLENLRKSFVQFLIEQANEESL